MPFDRSREGLYLDWLKQVTPIPTAAGREHRVVQWVESWASDREGVLLTRDQHGNITLALVDADSDEAPVYFTAHLDHPAFVVEEQTGPDTVRLSFRGGVMKDYFTDARITIHDGLDGVGATVASLTEGEPFNDVAARLDRPAEVTVGDVATWELPGPEILDTDNGAGETHACLHTPACDDLAALAAALSALEELRLLRAAGERTADARVLLTRAEEIGFVGAIGAARSGTMPKNARILALENSRSFPHDSPIGGGPIVRVGDRISVFSPQLTSAVAAVAEDLFQRPAQPRANQKQGDLGGAGVGRWQRKLMAGGACEASVFCAYGYQATCLCLPLGNYHNMADLAAVQAGRNTTPPRVAREYIAVSDYLGLIDLLVACGTELGDRGSFNDRIEKLWTERSFVLA